MDFLASIVDDDDGEVVTVESDEEKDKKDEEVNDEEDAEEKAKKPSKSKTQKEKKEAKPKAEKKEKEKKQKPQEAKKSPKKDDDDARPGNEDAVHLVMGNKTLVSLVFVIYSTLFTVPVHNNRGNWLRVSGAIKSGTCLAIDNEKLRRFFGDNFTVTKNPKRSAWLVKAIEAFKALPRQTQILAMEEAEEWCFEYLRPLFASNERAASIEYQKLRLERLRHAATRAPLPLLTRTPATPTPKAAAGPTKPPGTGAFSQVNPSTLTSSPKSSSGANGKDKTAGSDSDDNATKKDPQDSKAALDKNETEKEKDSQAGRKDNEETNDDKVDKEGKDDKEKGGDRKGQETDPDKDVANRGPSFLQTITNTLNANKAAAAKAAAKSTKKQDKKRKPSRSKSPSPPKKRRSGR